jgi:arsenate reductase
MKKVLLLSAGNPCRAIIAETILNKYIDKKLGIDFVGAGLEENTQINKNAMKLLADEGIDIEKLKPKILSEVENEDFDLVLTICAHSKEICPQFPRAVPTIHMEFPTIIDEDETTCKELAMRIKTKVKPLIIRELS